MQLSEMQDRFDSAFPKGARVCTDVIAGPEADLFWVARPVVLAEDAILITPVGSDFLVPYVLASEPEFADDGQSVSLTLADGGRQFRIDRWFDPVGLEDAIAEEQKIMDEAWVEIQRADYAAEMEASRG